MLRFLGLLAMIYLGVVAQSSLVPEGPGGIGQLFLPALMLVVIAACCEATLSVLLSGLVGLLLDGLSAERLGVQLVIATLLAFSTQLLQPLWRSRSVPALVAMVLLICAAWRILAPVACAVSVGRTVDPHRLMTIAVQEAAWTAAAACLLILAGRGLFGSGVDARITAGNVSPRWGTAGR